MKIIFLDIDGVLNTQDYILNHPDFEIDEECVKRLAKIVKATGADIVISSSWKDAILLEEKGLGDSEEFTLKYKRLKELFNKYNLNILSLTPTVSGHSQSSWREFEILKWLADNSQIESFVVIDDDSIELQSLNAQGRVVLTSGLQDCHVKQAISILNKNL